MLKKILLITALTAISVSFLGGCKKRPAQDQPEPQPPKSIAEYEAEAQEQINKNNMAEILNRIEEEVEEDINQEQ